MVSVLLLDVGCTLSACLALPLKPRVCPPAATWARRCQGYSPRHALQVTSKRVANAKSDKYHGNILKRGKVELQKVRSPSEGCLDAPPPQSPPDSNASSPGPTAFPDWCRGERRSEWDPSCLVSSSSWSSAQVRVDPAPVSPVAMRITSRGHCALVP